MKYEIYARGQALGPEKSFKHHNGEMPKLIFHYTETSFFFLAVE